MNCVICRSQIFDLVYDNIFDWEYGVKGSFAYFKCRKCDITQLFPFPQINDLKKAYPNEYPAYTENTGNFLSILHSKLITLHGLAFCPISNLQPRLDREESIILDVGSGGGGFLANLVKRGYKNLYGIDFNQIACNKLDALGIASYCGLFLDFNPQLKFNLISMNHYLEHVLDPLHELKHAYDLLIPNGNIIGTLPNFASFDRKFFRRFWGGNHVPRHTFQFSPKSLSTCLQKAGFKNIIIKQEINPSHIAISIQNYISHLLNKNYRYKFGRAIYYVPLLIVCTPLSILFYFAGQSGTMNFYAEK